MQKVTVSANSLEFKVIHSLKHQASDPYPEDENLGINQLTCYIITLWKNEYKR